MLIIRVKKTQNHCLYGKALKIALLHFWRLGFSPGFAIPKHMRAIYTHLVDSILEAVLTVSPKRQYRGILTPTTPAQTGPV
jgi:hypothetical protein